MIETKTKDRLEQFAGQPGGIAQPSQAGGLVPMQTESIVVAQRVAVPRDEEKVLNRLKVMAKTAGSEWYYRFPVKNRRENRVDYIEGPSIKLANALARIYGNCLVDSRVIDIGDSWIIYAKFTDLETGFTLTRPFQQRKSQRSVDDKDGGRSLDIALQIGASKAIRNVIVNALRDFADFGFVEAKRSLVDDIGHDLPQWRQRVIDGMGEKGIEIARAERVVGRAAKDWIATDIAKIIALAKAVDDGMATWDETFPPITPGDTGKIVEGQTLKDFGDGGDAADPETGEVKDSPKKEAVKTAPVAGDASGMNQNETTHDNDGATADAETEAAYRRGREARRKGMSFRASPVEWRDPGKEPLVKAWRQGWQDEDREHHAGANERDGG